MIKKSLLALSIFSALFASCNSKEKLIIGTWIPDIPKSKNTSPLTIQFLKDNTIIAKGPFDIENSNDSLTYEFNKEGNLLIVDKTSETAHELEIDELTEKRLILIDKTGSRDTLKLVRL